MTAGHPAHPRMEAGYPWTLCSARNCLYAHYVGPMSQSGLASQKLNIMAFEHELELTGTVYTIFVNQDDDEGVVDTSMETSNMTTTIRDINELQDCRIKDLRKAAAFWLRAHLSRRLPSSSSSWCGAQKLPHLRQSVQRLGRPPTRLHHVQLLRLHHRAAEHRRGRSISQ